MLHWPCCCTKKDAIYQACPAKSKATGWGHAGGVAAPCRGVWAVEKLWAANQSRANLPHVNLATDRRRSPSFRPPSGSSAQLGAICALLHP